MFNQFEPKVTPLILEWVRCNVCNQSSKKHIAIRTLTNGFVDICLSCAITVSQEFTKEIEKATHICPSCNGDGFFVVTNMYEVDPHSDKPESRVCSGCDGVGRVVKNE